MIDLERELRATLEEDAQHAPPAPDARAAIRRTRRGQAAVVLMALALIAAVVVGSIAGISGLIRADERTVPAGPTPTTAAVRVVLRDIEDQEGELAGLVYKGLWPPASRRFIGGFAVAVDADPFSTTQVVRRPQRVPQPNGECTKVRSPTCWTTSSPSSQAPTRSFYWGLTTSRHTPDGCRATEETSRHARRRSSSGREGMQP